MPAVTRSVACRKRSPQFRPATAGSTPAGLIRSRVRSIAPADLPCERMLALIGAYPSWQESLYDLNNLAKWPRVSLALGRATTDLRESGRIERFAGLFVRELFPTSSTLASFHLRDSAITWIAAGPRLHRDWAIDRTLNLSYGSPDWRVPHADVRIPLPCLRPALFQAAIDKRIRRRKCRLPEMRQQRRRAAIVVRIRGYVQEKRVRGDLQATWSFPSCAPAPRASGRRSAAGCVLL